MMGYYIVAGLIFLASSYISKKLKSKFKHYSEIQLKNGMSGREIAEKMLADNSITDVDVISVSGQLTDHYNPLKQDCKFKSICIQSAKCGSGSCCSP